MFFTFFLIVFRILWLHRRAQRFSLIILYYLAFCFLISIISLFNFVRSRKLLFDVDYLDVASIVEECFLFSLWIRFFFNVMGSMDCELRGWDECGLRGRAIRINAYYLRLSRFLFSLFSLFIFDFLAFRFLISLISLFISFRFVAHVFLQVQQQTPALL